jgi:hypothetical protein
MVLVSAIHSCSGAKRRLRRIGRVTTGDMTGFFLEKIGCLDLIERKKSKRSVRVGRCGDSMVKR